jgi:hypothetical protein
MYTRYFLAVLNAILEESRGSGGEEADEDTFPVIPLVFSRN